MIISEVDEGWDGNRANDSRIRYSRQLQLNAIICVLLPGLG